MGTTAALIALGAGGLLGGAASGLIGVSSARKNNEQSLDFSKWSQLQSQEYNRDMYERQLADQEDMYNKYQSPQAIARQLREAGLNPSAMNHSMQSGQMPSVPSAGTSSPVSAPSLENEGSYYGKSIEQISSAIGSVAGGALDFAQQKETNALLTAKLDNITKQNNLLESQKIFQDINNVLTDKFGEEKWAADIKESVSKAALNYINGDLAKANESYMEALKLIADEQLPIAQAERMNIATKIALGNQLMQSEIKANKASSVASYASAKRDTSQASVNEAVAYREQYFNTLRDDPAARESLLTEIKAAGDLAVAKKKLTKNQAAEMYHMAQQAAYANDMKKFTYWSDQVQGYLGIALGAAGAGKNFMQAQQLMTKPVQVTGF